jgi:hypothetical protein
MGAITETEKNWIRKGKEYLTNVFGEEIEDVRIEEFEQDNNNMYLTYSFLTPLSEYAKSEYSLLKYKRLYKEVIVDKEKNSIISVKMHQHA